jgi:hypothetical protein
MHKGSDFRSKSDAERMYKLSIRHYVRQCIEENVGVYKEMDALTRAELITELAPTNGDEIRAYIASVILRVIRTLLTDVELNHVMESISFWRDNCILMRQETWARVFTSFAIEFDLRNPQPVNKEPEMVMLPVDLLQEAINAIGSDYYTELIDQLEHYLK